MSEARPGTFWCRDCQMDVPLTIHDQHLAAHDDRDVVMVKESLMSSLVFWAGCIAAGVIAGLVIAPRL